MIIRIGKASDNDFVVNDPHVSRYHAKLIREEGGCWLLEDLGSTNGTFVNGAQIVKKHVTPSDTIKLGDNYVLNISEALKSNNDYSEEFAALKQVYDNYIQAKVKIQSSICSSRCSGGCDRFPRERKSGTVRIESVYYDLCSDCRYLPGCETVGQDPTVAARSDQSIQNRLCLPQMRNVFG